jgi:ParB-like chromosome segregation protein Spo0J
MTPADAPQLYQVLPDLSDDEYAALKEDVRQHGILVPVEVDEDGQIPDGHNRVRVWSELRAEGHTAGPVGKPGRVATG